MVIGTSAYEIYILMRIYDFCYVADFILPCYDICYRFGRAVRDIMAEFPREIFAHPAADKRELYRYHAEQGNLCRIAFRRGYGYLGSCAGIHDIVGFACRRTAYGIDYRCGDEPVCLCKAKPCERIRRLAGL